MTNLTVLTCSKKMSFFGDVAFNEIKISSVSFFSLKPLDIEFMKRLHDKVNVIPLIAKADTLTPEECQLFKKQVFVCISAARLGWMSFQIDFMGTYLENMHFVLLKTDGTTFAALIHVGT